MGRILCRTATWHGHFNIALQNRVFTINRTYRTNMFRSHKGLRQFSVHSFTDVSTRQCHRNAALPLFRFPVLRTALQFQLVNGCLTINF